MPELNSKEAGDNFYPKYNVVTRENVSNITITKGRLYTKDANNRLVAVGATGFINGKYQAAASIETAGTAGEHAVDVYSNRSRIGLPAKSAGLHGGQVIQYDIATHNVEAWSTAAASGATRNELMIIVGRIYKIYSSEEIDVEKQTTAVGDIVIVDFGEAL